MFVPLEGHNVRDKFIDGERAVVPAIQEPGIRQAGLVIHDEYVGEN